MPSAAASVSTSPASRDLRRAVAATYLSFAGSGFAFASWASRIPQVRDHLHLTPAHLGLVLFAIAAGSIIALPLAGPVVHRLGPRRMVAGTALLMALSLTVISLGYLAGFLPLVVGLFLLGTANGAWDVGMNVHGALVEHHLGHSIMSRFHAGYSLGTVTGALAGAAMVALHVTVTAHLLLVAVVVGFLIPWRTRTFLHSSMVEEQRDNLSVQRGAFAAWREPRTLLIGLFVVAFAFAEGTGNDWVGIATIDGYHTPAAMGTLAFAVFLSAMTLGRWFGPTLIDRYGRVVVLRALAVLGIGGTLLFVFAPTTPIAFVGIVLWGSGVSLGFPAGISAGADEPQYAAGRVSAIASIGYCAFLAGPPFVGFLSDRLTVLRSMVSAAVLLGVAALITTTAVRPPDADRSETPTKRTSQQTRS